jgi:hypothetical protein
MENNTNYASEIDLDQVKQKMRGYVSGFGDKVFDAMLFVKKHIVILITLFVIGAGVGTYLDREAKQYLQKVYVIPNFNSIDYLYEQVERIESKLKKNDKEFVKSLGIKNPELLTSIEIEPVVDIYDFLTQAGSAAEHEQSKVELFRIISDNADVNKVITEKVTSRNYRYHLITIGTSKEVERDEVVDPLLNMLNSNPYLLQVQKECIVNLHNKVKENDSIINQINKVIKGYSLQGGAASPSMLYYNNNTDITELLNLKNGLVNENGNSRITEIDFQKIIKDIAVVSNINEKVPFVTKLKVVLPLLLIGMFLVFKALQSFYKRQAAKRQIA